jgi:hypothetical protein
MVEAELGFSMTDRDDFRSLIDMRFLALRDQHLDLSKKLDHVIVLVSDTNNRLGKTEDDVIRLQERISPWAAGGASGAGALSLAWLYEFFKHKP